MKEKFDVTGMSCSACSSHVEKSVSKLEGIKTVSVNLLTNSMQVEYDETKLDTGKIMNHPILLPEHIKRVGFKGINKAFYLTI